MPRKVNPWLELLALLVLGIGAGLLGPKLASWLGYETEFARGMAIAILAMAIVVADAFYVSWRNLRAWKERNGIPVREDPKP